VKTFVCDFDIHVFDILKLLSFIFYALCVVL